MKFIINKSLVMRVSRKTNHCSINLKKKGAGRELSLCLISLQKIITSIMPMKDFCILIKKRVINYIRKGA